MLFPFFIFGAIFGSFINVLALRYDPDKFLLGRHVIGGRSRCPSCKSTLRWYELVPLISFVAQRRRCRTCGDRISFQYPIVEALCGLIFALVPLRAAGLYAFFTASPLFSTLAALWVVCFAALLLLSLIDLRLFMIPDEINIFLGLIGIGVTAATAAAFASAGLPFSFLGPYELLFGSFGGVWENHIAGALIAGLFFGLIVLITRGRGMGMGDVKLSIPLGFLFGWPDIAVVIGLSFMIGAVWSVWKMFRAKATLKTAVPFGPFLALAVAVVFFFGEPLVRFYFNVFAEKFF